MPWHCSALCWCYVMLVTCPGCAWGQHKASVKPAQDSGGENILKNSRSPAPPGMPPPPRTPLQNNIFCVAKQLFRILILLTLCSVYTGLCVCVFIHVFMRCLCGLIMQKKRGVFDDSFTLLLMLALCAASLCEQCFTFCFMLALCIIF